MFSFIFGQLNSVNLVLLSFSVFLVIFYHLIWKNWNYFTVRNVPFVRGIPILGSLWPMFIGRKSFADVILEHYRRFNDARFFGIYEILHPVFVVRDPDLVKQITVQDFEHFTNHQGNFDVDVDSLLARTLFFSRNQEWKDMRNILTPAFTGTKMRMMFDLVRDSTSQFMKNLKIEAEHHQHGREYEFKDLFTRYACSIIATCAFGLNVDAITNRDDDFYLAGKKITNFDGWQGIKFLLFDCIPRIMKLFRVKFFEPKLMEYFRSVIRSTIKFREQTEFYRPDMVHLLMLAQKGTLDDSTPKLRREWHDDDITAQCLVFFFAGFETMSTLLSFMSYELAINPNIQNRLYEEIRNAHSNVTEIAYENIQKLPYLDMVVSETLRRWPPIAGTDRQCTKPYRMENSDGTIVNLTTQDTVWIAIFGIQTDEKYWPEPEKFDPERFNEENRKNIKQCSYLPFGNGQRVCIASRFALMVAKSLFYSLLNEYEIVKCDRTPVPLKLKPSTINMMADGGFWLNLRRREQK